MTYLKPKFGQNLGFLANMVATVSLISHILNPGLAYAQVSDPSIVNSFTSTSGTTTMSQTAGSALFSAPVDAEEIVVEEEEDKPDLVMVGNISVYTSTPGQTDDSPFIAATGKRVHDGMIAANGLPFGTKIRIPDLYGDKIFVVEDRMNKRYGLGHFDIWLDTTRKEALKFGRKHLKVEIFYPEKAVAKK